MSIAPAFRSALLPFARDLDDTAVTELVVNRPGEYWLAKQGQRHMTMVEAPDLTVKKLELLADAAGSYTMQEADIKSPLLSSVIPIDLNDDVPDDQRGGYRVQVVKPPAVEIGMFSICIRKPALLDIDLEFYEKQGAFSSVNNPDPDDSNADDQLADLYKRKQWHAFLEMAIKQHKNIAISAGTNTGKTTALNAMLKVVPLTERVATIEDSREIKPPQPNRIHLLYSRGGQGVARVDARSLLEAALRLSPDRIIMGELRGAEAYDYLDALNTGHGGSITTIHANSPNLMFERLARMVLRADNTLSKDQVIEYARSLIDVVIQFKRGNDGRRYISEIHYAP